MSPLRCPHCGARDNEVRPDVKHTAGAWCAACHCWIAWLGKEAGEAALKATPAQRRKEAVQRTLADLAEVEQERNPTLKSIRALPDKEEKR